MSKTEEHVAANARFDELTGVLLQEWLPYAMKGRTAQAESVQLVCFAIVETLRFAYHHGEVIPIAGRIIDATQAVISAEIQALIDDKERRFAAALAALTQRPEAAS